MRKYALLSMPKYYFHRFHEWVIDSIFQNIIIVVGKKLYMYIAVIIHAQKVYRSLLY